MIFLAGFGAGLLLGGVVVVLLVLFQFKPFVARLERLETVVGRAGPDFYSRIRKQGTKVVIPDQWIDEPDTGVEEQREYSNT